MNISFSIRHLLMGFTFSLLLSCDDDVSDVGTDILTGTNIGVETQEFSVPLNAISLKKVQTNNLKTQYLGNHEDSIFKNKSTYGILSGVGATSSTFPVAEGTTITNIEIKSKKLILPFPYSDNNVDQEQGGRVYILDAPFCNSKNLKIQVFNANYSLRSRNPNSNNSQRYFADGSDETTNFSEIIEKDTKLISENSVEIVTPSKTVVIPDSKKQDLNAIEIEIDKLDLSDLAAKNDFEVFSGADAEFLERVKSIYIKPLADNEGFLRIPSSQIDSIAPKIQLDFIITTQEGAAEPKQNTLIVDYNLNSQLFFNLIKTDEVTEPSAESVSIISGAGASAETTLFSNAELEELAGQNVIVNDATLVFTVNKSALPNGTELKNLPVLVLFRTETGQRINISTPTITPITPVSGTINENNNEEFTYNFDVTRLAQLILTPNNLDDAKELNVKLGLGTVEIFSDNLFSSIFNNESTKFTNDGTILSFKGVPLFSNATAQENNNNRPKLILKYTATK
ncbi:DUF4270 family protein [Aquimarina agarivorans]|uniref:DUF4270 family protein n=1 Tax=Aquimarina agarivorans TaxID=980584 RepID=UPI000248EAE3|nr:DUF4270 family protein [Aquimarina agarivorans]